MRSRPSPFIHGQSVASHVVIKDQVLRGEDLSKQPIGFDYYWSIYTDETMNSRILTATSHRRLHASLKILDPKSTLQFPMLTPHTFMCLHRDALLVSHRRPNPHEIHEIAYDDLNPSLKCKKSVKWLSSTWGLWGQPLMFSMTDRVKLVAADSFSLVDFRDTNPNASVCIADAQDEWTTGAKAACGLYLWNLAANCSKVQNGVITKFHESWIYMRSAPITARAFSDTSPIVVLATQMDGNETKLYDVRRQHEIAHFRTTVAQPLYITGMPSLVSANGEILV